MALRQAPVRIGGASGYWGETAVAMPQFLADPDLDYIVFDYLAEITMSIMARSRAKDPHMGYAPDFISQMIIPHASDIKKQGVKIISNAGGVNPMACGAALRSALKQANIDLTVAVVTGDDVSGDLEHFHDRSVREMFNNEPFPATDTIASANAYLGAFPIAQALATGADIVVTGRVVDSAVTLGACIHEFGWSPDDYDQLAGASLAGHIIECGAQATGGNHTDWHLYADHLKDVGYPIAEVAQDGSFVCTKLSGTGGAVTCGTVGEQMLYEIGDPKRYLLPDVTCDFSRVTITQEANDRVAVRETKGTPPSPEYKVSVTYHDGYRIGQMYMYYGEDASAKARSFANAAVDRARGKLRQMNVADFDEVLIETFGDESHYGDYATQQHAREVIVKIAAKHQEQNVLGVLVREATGLALSAPPGLCGFAGGRPKASPVFRLFSCLVPKSRVHVQVHTDTESVECSEMFSHQPVGTTGSVTPAQPTADGETVSVELKMLAYTRSGDKGNKANVGVLPRHIAFGPYLFNALDMETLYHRFKHLLAAGCDSVERFYLPGTGATNILLDGALGGGGIASLRNDPQGKGFSQIILQLPVTVPKRLLEELTFPRP